MKLVGPVLQDREMAEAVEEAVRRDNPGVDVVVEDRHGYIRVHTPQRCRITRASLEEVLGRPFKLSELEVYMSSFAGRIRFEKNEVVFYLETEEGQH